MTMGKLSGVCWLPFEAGYRFKLSGRRFRVTENGERTLECLRQIYSECCISSDCAWAIRTRPIIREIQASHQVAVLTLVVDRTPDPVLRILAIWLRGRCRGTVGTKILAKCGNHPDFHTRKEAVRALKRMSAWSVLDDIANSDPNERIRRMATCKPSRPISQRIADFTLNLARLSTSEHEKRLYLSSKLDITRRKPPKSLATIRNILKRIHLLVSGNGH